METAEVQGDRVGARPEPNTVPLNEDGTTGVKKSKSVKRHQSRRGWFECYRRAEKSMHARSEGKG